MRVPNYLVFATFASGIVLGACNPIRSAGPPAVAPVDSVIDGVVWTVGNWEKMLPAGEKGYSWGNHRAVVRVDSAVGSAVAVSIPWRRHDRHPENKAVVLVDSLSGDVVANTLVRSINSESGEIVFEPKAGSRTYFAYYYPYWTTGGYYPRLQYWSQDSVRSHYAPSSEWVRNVESLSAANQLSHRADVARFESINDFHSFFPMEIAATEEEVRHFQEASPAEFYLFPEHRERPIRIASHLPVHWVKGAADNGSVPFEVVARRGEYFTFQVGVFSPRQDLGKLQVSYEDFAAEGEELGAPVTCFNAGGIDLNGQAFDKRIDVTAGTVQALWFGLQIPESANPQTYVGQVVITSEDGASKRVEVRLAVLDEFVDQHGDNHPENMSRLRWLNSKIGSDPDYIIDPFIPVTVTGSTLRILGREVVLASTGLPSNIRSYFAPELTSLNETSEEILADPLALDVVVQGSSESWESTPYTVVETAAGRADWYTTSSSSRFVLDVAGSLEYDGMLDLKIGLVAKESLKIDDIALPVVYDDGAAIYMLGLGRTGRKRDELVDWKWKVEHHQEGVWLGNVNKGLQFVLRDENYERPLNTNFYLSKPLNLPPSWYNNGLGGIRIAKQKSGVVARAYSGPRRMAVGDTLHFNVRFLITPFKPIDTRTHFNTRFVHKYVPVDSVRSWGGTVVNIHHANEINPYINYPFYNLDKQTAYIEEAHSKGVKVKLYDTIRELTYKAHELFPIRSLGYEVFNDGNGGGHSWLQEHLGEHYYPAWHAFRVDDAAILDKGTSRWTNYYVEGLNWLAENQKIDGLYLDDIAFSRETVKRMVTVLDTHRDGVVIDLHSANQFNPRDGYINSAMLYMEHFPFISRLWFGEYFDYGQDPDYWLTEVSGLPFGLMGEMLQDCGRPYRGMLYGMTTRVYGDCDPRPIWKLFDSFGISDSRMLGYWLTEKPIRTSSTKVLATTFLRSDRVLVALASWADEDMDIQLDIDWNSLGLSAESASIIVPGVDGLQEHARYEAGRTIRVLAGRGLLLIIE